MCCCGRTSTTTPTTGRRAAAATFALFAAACVCLPGGLLLALAGRPGALWFAGTCFVGFVVAENREAAAQRRRRAP